VIGTSECSSDTTGVSQGSQVDYEKATTPRRGFHGVLLAVVVLVMVAVTGTVWLRTTMAK
jgi:hypothetical protein